MSSSVMYGTQKYGVCVCVRAKATYNVICWAMHMHVTALLLAMKIYGQLPFVEI